MSGYALLYIMVIVWACVGMVELILAITRDDD